MASNTIDSTPSFFATTISVNPHQQSDAQLYPDEVFVGGFSADSPAYAASCIYSRIASAHQPGTYEWSYEAKLVTYTTHCSAAIPYAVFSLHHPVAITTGYTGPYLAPFALFGMVRSISQWSKDNPREISYAITVEVHTYPGFRLDWSQTLPWPLIPIGAMFIYPHSFQNIIHQPFPLTAALLKRIINVEYDASTLHRKIRDNHQAYRFASNLSNSRHTQSHHTPLPATTRTSTLQPFTIYSQRTGEPITGSDSEDEEEVWE
jgi:hypothetical protein